MLFTTRLLPLMSLWSRLGQVQDLVSQLHIDVENKLAYMLARNIGLWQVHLRKYVEIALEYVIKAKATFH